MKKFSKVLLSTLAFAILAAVFGTIHPKPAGAQGQGGPTVRVVNTTSEPVPTAAQGTTAVSGSVNAVQSGTWNVGIAGTPTVKLDATANAVRVDRPENFQRVETVTWSGQASEAFTTNFTDKFSNLRVCVAHTGPNPIQVNVFSLVIGSTSSAFFTYDAYIIGSPNTVCKVYELPGASTQVLLSNTGVNTTGIARLALVGF